MSAQPEGTPLAPAPDDVMPHILVRRLHRDAVLPAYARPGDAGADLSTVEAVHLEPGARALVRTGIAIAIPAGWVGLVHPRSWLAARCGLSIVNAPGTIDSGYRGEILVNLLNTDPRTAIELRPGDRIAQLLLQRVGHALFVAADSLPESSRGETGHGSTGGFSAAPPRPATSSTKDPE